jgi:radical SAM protein with 4Fe4S-binding SPASM domain
MYSCVFCVHPQLERRIETMPMPLYRKIVDEAATIPYIEKLTITGLGETLQDRFLVERVFYARSVLPPGVTIDLYTAGGLLRPKLTDALIAAGLDVIYISLNAVTREKRAAIMGVDDFDKVVAHAQYALAATQHTKCRVIVKGVASKDLMEVGEHEAFQQQWGGDWDKGGAAYLHLEGNWAGRIGAPMRTKPSAACGRALGQIMVLVDGRVSACCFDGHGEKILGDLNRQTLREMYGSEIAVAFRQAHAEGRRQEIPLCAGCTSI